LSSSVVNKPTPSSSITNNWRMITIPQLNGNSTWKTNTRSPIITPKTLPKQQIIPQISNNIF
jgi:hypothetical protein